MGTPSLQLLGRSPDDGATLWGQALNLTSPGGWDGIWLNCRPPAGAGELFGAVTKTHTLELVSEV